MKCPLARTWANFISHRARRDISQCAVAHYFTFCGSKTFHYMHLCLQMQCLSRKKDEEFLQFFVLFLLVGVSFFHTALSQPPIGGLFCWLPSLIFDQRPHGQHSYAHSDRASKSVGDREKQLSVVFRREIAKIRSFEAEQAQAHKTTIFSGVSMTVPSPTTHSLPRCFASAPSPSPEGALIVLHHCTLS